MGEQFPLRNCSTAPRLCTPQPPTVRLDVGRSEPLLSSCMDPVRRTVLNARAPSTRLQYDNRWKLFSVWCMGRNTDPVHCSVLTVLEFRQSLPDNGRSSSTLRVYVAAISCRHAKVDNGTVGGHNLVSLFLKGARRLFLQRAPRPPAWDLPLVLVAIWRPPF